MNAPDVSWIDAYFGAKGLHLGSDMSEAFITIPIGPLYTGQRNFYSYYQNNPYAGNITSNFRLLRTPKNDAPKVDSPKTTSPATIASVVESVNTPQTPAENLSTNTVTLTPPADGNYSHSEIYYRVNGSGKPFVYAGPAKNTFAITSAMDGTTYEIQARPVSISGVESPSGPTTTKTVTSGTGGANLASGNYIASGQTAYDTGTGFYMVNEAGTPKFSIGNSAGNKMTWSGTVLSIVGTITATLGNIGGWLLGTTSLTSGSGANTVGLDSGGTNPAIYAGSATPGSAPFRVTQAGALTATSGTVGGWSMGATTLTGGGLVFDSTNTRARFTSGSNYVEIGATGIVGVDSILGTTFSLPVNGAAPTFSSGMLNSVTYNLYASSVIRTSNTVGGGGASDFGVLMNSAGVRGYKASSTTPTFILDSATGDASFGQTTTTKYVKFTASSGDVELGRDTKIIGVDGYNNDDFVWKWSGDSIDAVDTSATTGGAVVILNTQGGLVARLNTSAAGTARYIFDRWALNNTAPTFSKDRYLKFVLQPQQTPSTNQTWNFGSGVANLGSGRGIGVRFKASSLAIYAFSHNGTTETELDLTTTLTAVQSYLIEIVFLTGVSVAFYVDKVLKGTITTNLPTLGTDANRLFVCNGISTVAPAADTNFVLLAVKFVQMP